LGSALRRCKPMKGTGTAFVMPCMCSHHSRVFQAKCQIQHVVLLVVWLGQDVVVLRRDDYVACRASHGTLACTWGQWSDSLHKRPLSEGQKERRGAKEMGDPTRFLPDQTCTIPHAQLTFQVHVVLVRQAQDIVPLVPLDRLDQFPLGILEMELDAGTGCRALDLAVPPGCGSALTSVHRHSATELTGRGCEGAGEGDDGADEGLGCWTRRAWDGRGGEGGRGHRCRGRFWDEAGKAFEKGRNGACHLVGAVCQWCAGTVKTVIGGVLPGRMRCE